MPKQRKNNNKTKVWIPVIVALIGFLGIMLPLFYSDLFGFNNREFKFAITVQDASSLEPVEKAKILLSVPGEAPYEDYTDSNGISSLNIPEQISGENGRFSVTANGFERHDRNLTIRQKQQPSIVRLYKVPLPFLKKKMTHLVRLTVYTKG